MGAVTQPVPLYREVDGWLGGMRLFGASVRFYAHNAGSSAGGRNNCLPTSTRTRLGTQASYREHLYSRAVRSRGLSLLSLSAKVPYGFNLLFGAFPCLRENVFYLLLSGKT